MRQSFFAAIGVMALLLASCNEAGDVQQALKDNDFAKANELVGELYLNSKDHGPDSKYSRVAYVAMKAEADFLIEKGDKKAESYLLDLISKFDLGASPRELPKLAEGERDDDNEEYMLASQRFNDFCRGVVDMALDRNLVSLAYMVTEKMVPTLHYSQRDGHTSSDIYRDGKKWKHYCYYTIDRAAQSKAQTVVIEKIVELMPGAIKSGDVNAVNEMLGCYAKMDDYSYNRYKKGKLLREIANHIISNPDIELESLFWENLNGVSSDIPAFRIGKFKCTSNEHYKNKAYNDKVTEYNTVVLSILQLAAMHGNKTFAKKLRGYLKPELDCKEVNNGMLCIWSYDNIRMKEADDLIK